MQAVTLRFKPIAPEEVARFRRAMEECRIVCPIGHGSYLVNLASPEQGLWTRSVKAFAVELRRAETLGLGYLVTHPGCYINGHQEEGLRRIVQAIDAIHKETSGIRAQCLLETTAGQGTSLGWRFEQLAAMPISAGGRWAWSPFVASWPIPAFSKRRCTWRPPKEKRAATTWTPSTCRSFAVWRQAHKVARSLRDRDSGSRSDPATLAPAHPSQSARGGFGKNGSDAATPASR